ncbi:hypothetical protein [Fischerella thermalis]|nr:hypothetical protein [Fischerella thermalis]
MERYLYLVSTAAFCLLAKINRSHLGEAIAKAIAIQHRYLSRQKYGG